MTRRRSAMTMGREVVGNDKGAGGNDRIVLAAMKIIIDDP